VEAISQLIFNLLAQRQPVILPGLGTLRVEHTPPRVDEDTRRIVSPVSRVVFSPETDADPTLPQWIAERSGLPLKEVRPQYNRWLAAMRRDSIDGEYVVAGVGILLRQPDGSYRVETAPELDRWLNPIEAASIPLPSPKPGAGPTRKNRRSNRAAWLAAAGALLVILLYGVYYFYGHEFFGRRQPATVSTQAQQPVTVAPTDTLPVPDDPTTASPQTASTAAPQAASATATPVPRGEAYHLIAGVYSTRANAERCIREEGLEATTTTIIPTAIGQFMVSAGRYATKPEADAALRVLKQQIPGAWISKRKN